MTFVVQTSRVLAAMLLVGVLSALTGCSSETEAQAVPGSAKAAKLKQCIRPTEFMRRNHMELIKHQRDITVREGVRATSDSLAACIACHVQYDSKGHPIPVNAEDQFCDRCHDWLGVEPDCFGCHSTVPEGPQPSNLEHTWPEVFGTKQDKQAPSPKASPAGESAPPPVVEPEAAPVEPEATPAKPAASAVAEPAPAEPEAVPAVVDPVPAVAPVEQGEGH